MADRTSRSILEFVTEGDQAVVSAYDKIDKKARDTGKAVSGLSLNLGTALAAFSGAAIVDRMAGALFTFGKQAFDSAGQILDLSNRTGLATETIQQMQEVANQTGTSLEAFTASAFRLGVNLADGTKKSRDAVAALGLSYADLAAQRPDEQFTRVIAALENVDNQQERNRLGVALFGKQFAEIAAAVQEGYTGIAGAARISSDEQLQALDTLGDAWTKFNDDVSNGVRSAAGAVVLYFREAYAAATLDLSKFSEAEQSRLRDAMGSFEDGALTKTLNDIATARKTDIDLSGQQATAQDHLSDALAEAREEVSQLSAAKRANIEAGLALGKSYEEISKHVQISEEAFALYRKQVQEAAQTEKQHAAEAVKNLAERQKAGREYYNWIGEREIAAAEVVQQRIEQEAEGWREYYNWLGERRMEDEAAAIASQQRIAAGASQMFQSMMTGGGSMNGTGAWMPRPTVPMNSPNAGGGLWSRMNGFLGGGSQWGNIASAGIGSLTSLIPGQSNIGRTIGSIAGSFFGPVGTMLGGLAGGLIGNLFGGGEGGKTKKARNEWIEQFGGLDKLKSEAAAAGVSLDKLFSAKNRKDLEREIKVVTEALEGHKQKVKELNAELDSLRDEESKLREQTTVTYDMMRDSADKFGINQGALGKGFQQGRLNADAKEMIEALEIFKRGNADMGTVLFGMRDELSALVRDSAQFGTEIPENLRPFIEHLLESGNLLDENGQAMKELPQIKFGDAMASQLEKASDRLAEVVDRIADVLSELDRLDGRQVSFDVNANYTGGQPGGTGGGDGGGGGDTSTPHFYPDMGLAAAAAINGVRSVSPAAMVASARAMLSGAALDGAQAALNVNVDGNVLARVMIRRTGRNLSLVGA